MAKMMTETFRAKIKKVMENLVDEGNREYIPPTETAVEVMQALANAVREDFGIPVNASNSTTMRVCGGRINSAGICDSCFQKSHVTTAFCIRLVPISPST